MKRRAFRLCAAMVLVSAFAGCIDPKDRRPGMRLTGDVVNEAITDWTFANEFQEVFLETKTWYLVPHSVTTVCAGSGERLYVPTVYFEGGEWTDNDCCSGKCNQGQNSIPEKHEDGARIMDVDIEMDTAADKAA